MRNPGRSDRVTVPPPPAAVDRRPRRPASRLGKDVAVASLLLTILFCCGCGSTTVTVRSDFGSLYEAGVRACTTMGYARLDPEQDVFDRRHGLISLSRRERFMEARRAIVSVQREHPDSLIPRELKVSVREEDTVSFILTLFVGGNERLEEQEAILVDMIREYHASGATGAAGGDP